MGQQDEADDDSSHEISENYLQKCEVGVICQTWNADDGEGAGFRGHNGQSDGPPRNVAVGQEVVAKGALLLAETQSEQRNTREIDANDREIEVIQTHRSVDRRSCARAGRVFMISGSRGLIHYE